MSAKELIFLVNKKGTLACHLHDIISYTIHWILSLLQMELIMSIIAQLEPENIKYRLKLEEKHKKICQKKRFAAQFC
jgi:hypothetical protein